MGIWAIVLDIGSCVTRGCVFTQLFRLNFNRGDVLEIAPPLFFHLFNFYVMKISDLSHSEKSDLLNECFAHFDFKDFNHFFEVIDETEAMDAIIEELFSIVRPVMRHNFALSLREKEGYFLVTELAGQFMIAAVCETYDFALLAAEGLATTNVDVEIWRIKDTNVICLNADGSTETVA